MSELSREMEKHANPIKWRKTNGGWVGNKIFQFPSKLAFILSTEKMEKHNKEEYVVKCCCQFWMAIKWSRSTQNQK